MRRRWSRGPTALFAAPGNCGGAMARSRRIMDKTVLVGAVLGVAVLAVLVGQIALANGFVSECASISDLRADRAYLQARVGLLERDWNERTSRTAIVERAVELGLVTPDAPSSLIVIDTREDADRNTLLQKALKVVGAAEAHASENGSP